MAYKKISLDKEAVTLLGMHGSQIVGALVFRRRNLNGRRDINGLVEGRETHSRVKLECCSFVQFESLTASELRTRFRLALSRVSPASAAHGPKLKDNIERCAVADKRLRI